MSSKLQGLIERGKLAVCDQVMRSRLNILVWIVICLFLLGTGAWTVWAIRQPRTHSIWRRACMIGYPHEKSMRSRLFPIESRMFSW